MLENLKYYKGNEKTNEIVEVEIYKHGQYYTTCVINVYLLISDVKIFPCGTGDDYELKSEELVQVLEFIQKQREAIIFRYPVKSVKNWEESGLPTFRDYCKPGDIVDKDIVDYFMSCYPPLSMSSSYVQCGEPCTNEMDDNNKYRLTYVTFVRISSSQWRFVGYCFEGETTNRAEVKTSLELYIEKVKQGLKRTEE